MFWKNNKEWVIVLTFSAIIGVAYYFGIRKIREDIVAKEAKIKEVEAKQWHDQERIRQLATLKDDYEMVLEGEKRFPSLLDKDQVVELYGEIDRIGAAAGTKVEYSVVDPPDVFPGKSKNAPKEGETIGGSLPVKEIMQLRIRASGPFPNVLNLMKMLENNEYLLDIVSIDMRVESKSSQAQTRLARGNENQMVSQELLPDSINATFNTVFYLKQ